MLATKSDDLSSVPRNHTEGREPTSGSCPLTSTHMLGHAGGHTHIHRIFKCKKEKLIIKIKKRRSEIQHIFTSVLQLRNCFGELSRVSVSTAQVVTILRGLLKATLCYLEGGQQEANGLCFCIVH